MANPNKAKGTRWETLVEEFFSQSELEEQAFRAKRTGSADADLSDIRLGMFGEWLLECKDWAEIKLSTFLKQLDASKIRARVLPFKGAVIVKNRRQPVSEAYTVMRLADYKQLVTYVMALEELIRNRTGEDLAALGWNYSTPEDENNG